MIPILQAPPLNFGPTGRFAIIPFFHLELLFGTSMSSIIFSIE